MSDSIPSASADPESTQDHPLPANAEDRKAAAALSSLNTNEIGADSRGEGEEEGGGGGGGARGSKLPSSADQEALGKAMSRLEIAAGKGPGKKRTTEAQNKDEATEGVKKKAAVKVAADDVALLVNELDLSKVKATELLKAYDGDVKKAVRAFITPVVGA